MSEYNQEQSVVGRCITGACAQMVQHKAKAESFKPYLKAIGQAVKEAWQELYPEDVLEDPGPYSYQHDGPPKTVSTTPQAQPPPQAPSPPVSGYFAQPNELWELENNLTILPHSIDTMGKWGDQVPYKNKNQYCVTTGEPWDQMTYSKILDSIQVELDAPNKPKFKSDWSTLSWLINGAKCFGQYEKANTWKVGCLKAVMTEIARVRPFKLKELPKKPSEGRAIPDADETQQMLSEKMDEPTPF